MEGVRRACDASRGRRENMSTRDGCFIVMGEHVLTGCIVTLSSGVQWFHPYNGGKPFRLDKIGAWRT